MSKSDSSSSSPPSSPGGGDDATVKKARETLAVILRNMDKDLSLQVVLASLSFKYQNVVEKAATCSDLMYLREMLASIANLKEPSDKNVHGYTSAEVMEHLLKFGYVV